MMVHINIIPLYQLLMNGLMVQRNYMKNIQFLNKSKTGLSSLASSVVRFHHNAKFISNIKGEPLEDIQEDIKSIRGYLKHVRVIKFRLNHIAKNFQRDVEIGYLYQLQHDIERIEFHISCLERHLPKGK